MAFNLDLLEDFQMKKIFFSAWVILFVFISSAFASLKISTEPLRPFADSDELQYVPNEFVVKFQSGVGKISPRLANGVVQVDIPRFDVLSRTFKVDKMEPEFPAFRAKPGLPDLSLYYVLKFRGPFKLERVLEAYSKLPFVHHVEPIGINRMYGVPDDPYFGPAGHPDFPPYQWHFEQATADHDVDASAAWDLETGNAAVLVGIIDSGVRYYHKDLGGYLAPDDVSQGNMWINYGEYGNGKESNRIDDDNNGYVDDWIGWDWVDGIRGCAKGEDCKKEDNDPRDFDGHGTHVAGIVGAISNNSYAVAGLAGGWNSGFSSPANGVKLMALRAGWRAASGLGYVRMDFCAKAIRYAADMGVTAINCSWGSSNSGGLADAVNYAIAKGVLIIHAAGNSNSESPDYLGSRTDVMNVAATDSFDVKAYFSNYGTWVDVSAPGVDVLSTWHNADDPDYDYIRLISGTSQACPHVTGLAALLKSYEPTLTSSDIWNYIVSYADPIDPLNPGYAGKLGSGRINAYNSLNAVAPPPPDTIPPADVTDLVASPGASNGTVDLSWSAPGDDGNSGTATTYDVRYQEASLGPLDTEAEWNDAFQATGEPSPKPAGTQESFTVTGLTPGTAYYFALKTADEVPNWSDLSNSDSATAKVVVEMPMYVNSIGMSLVAQGPWRKARATPEVVEDSAPYQGLAGVTVYGHWYGAASDVDQCVTGSDGKCTVESDRVKNPSESFCFQVDSLKKADYYWDDTKGVKYNCISSTAKQMASFPVEFVISQNYPNPFNPMTEFSISLSSETNVSLTIYNVVGQKVRTLVDEVLPAGSHVIIWNGTNDRGDPLSSGVYFYRVIAGEQVVTRKMMLLK